MIQVYEERADRFGRVRQEEEARSQRLGWVRVFVFCLGFLFYLGYDLLSGPPGRVCAVFLGVAALVFLVLVHRHRRVKARRKWSETMEGINRTALARASRDWDALPPSPMEDPACHHSYALDLDVCGGASLFRLLTTVTLPPGVETLRRWLLEPADPEEVLERQEAVSELAPKLEFRQTLEARGRLTESPPVEPVRKFLEWAEADPWFPGRRWVLGLAWGLPLSTAVLLGLLWSGAVEGLWWFLSMGATFGFTASLRNKIHPVMDLASAGQERFGRYAALLSLLLEEEVTAPSLEKLKAAVLSSPVGAEKELRRLGRLVGWADVRFSPMAHAPLQGLFAWDIHVLARLEEWKRRSGPHVRRWLEVLGELEALSALAALKADHPDWCFPELDRTGPPRISGRDLGHPLLPPDACVKNDVEIGPPGTFLFVTGSNMSGKSTLLRAVGLNTVLAQAGGPVCAGDMAMSPLNVQTSMRTTDSLSEGVSQYMAELNRIKLVVDAARDGVGDRTGQGFAPAGGDLAPAGDPSDREIPPESAGGPAVLYLLDEPLQGTNEAERRVAVQTILGHLLEAGAIGGVATHDLHLDGAEPLKGAARAVHLEGTVGNGEAGPLLTFDYKLKPGRATSTNALALLRAVGLGEQGKG